ncbi:MAG: hypothetical protein WCS52_17520 [bacterium]
MTGAVLAGISSSRVFPSTSQHPADTCHGGKEILIANDLRGRCLSLIPDEVRHGEVDPRIANAVGYLANVILKALEQGEVESRLAELEAAVKGHRTPSNLTIMEAS